MPAAVPTPLAAPVPAAVPVAHDAVASWWTVAVLLVVAGLLVWLAVRAGLTARRARRAGATGHRARAWVLGAGATVVLAGALAVGANTWSGYLPTWRAVAMHLGWSPTLTMPDAPSSMPGAAVATVTTPPPSGEGRYGTVRVPVPPDLHVAESDTWVYLPPGFDPSGATLYPVVVLVHGSPGQSADWFGAGLPQVLDRLITTGAVRPMIAVSPDVNVPGASESACLDSTRGGAQVESYLQDVLRPWLQAHLPVAVDRRYQAFGGMSSGAYCALDQGLRHSATYGTILAIMPYGTPGAGADTELTTAAQVEAHSPSVYVGTVRLVSPTAVFLAYGSQEPDAEVPATASLLDRVLRQRGQPVELQVLDGYGHTWATAMAALPAALTFFERQMAREDP